MSWAQELAEADIPLAPVGYTHSRRALDYNLMVSAEFGTWWKEYITLAELAKAEIGETSQLSVEYSVTNGKGAYEAFILATGELTQFPFHLPTVRMPQVDEIVNAVSAAFVDLGVLDHIGFNLGFADSKVGMTTHPATGQAVCLLDTETITHLFSHPWRRAMTTPSIEDSFRYSFDQRASVWDASSSGIDNATNGKFGHIMEGGAVTPFPSATWKENVMYGETSFTWDQANTEYVMTAPVTTVGGTDYERLFPPFDGDYVRAFLRGGGVDHAQRASMTSLPYRNGVNHTEFTDFSETDTSGTASNVDNCLNILTGFGINRHFGKYMDSNFTDGNDATQKLGSNFGSAMPRLHTCGRATALEWLEILNYVRSFTSSVVYTLNDVTGRTKTSLPTGRTVITHTPGATYGSLLHNSMRDGFIHSLTPAFNLVSKLTLDSQNGPLFLTKELFAGLSSQPFVIAASRWGRWDSATNTVRTLSGNSQNLTMLDPMVVGETMSGTLNVYLPPGIAETDVTRGDPSGMVYSDLLSMPIDGIRTSMTSAGVAEGQIRLESQATVPTAYGIAGIQAHFHPCNGFVRGMIRGNVFNVAGTEDIEKNVNYFFAWNPHALGLSGDAWRMWAGTYMGATSWFDPYRLMPFETTSVWATLSDTSDARYENWAGYASVTGFDDNQHKVDTANDYWLPALANVTFNEAAGLYSQAVVPSGGLLNWNPLKMDATKLDDWAVEYTTGAGGMAGTTGPTVITSSVENYPVINVGHGIRGYGYLTTMSGVSFARPRNNTSMFGGPALLHKGTQGHSSELFYADTGYKPNLRTSIVEGSFYYGIGNYMLNSFDNQLAPELMSPYSWLHTLYRGGAMQEEMYVNPVVTEGIQEPDAPSNYQSIGATSYANALGSNSPVDVAGATAGAFGTALVGGVKRSLLEWDSDTALPNSVEFDNRRNRWVNPWVKATDNGFGWLRVNYESPHSTDAAIRAGLRDSYRAIYQGLNNDLFRSLQVIN